MTPSIFSSRRRRRRSNDCIGGAPYSRLAADARRFARCAGLVGGITAVGLSACSRSTRPWEQNEADASAVLEARAAHQRGGAIFPDAAAYDSDGGDDLPLSVPVGGAWLRCYDGFRLTGDATKDVTRLALLCGPSTGMHRFGGPKALEGEIAEGGVAVTSTVPVRRGDCARVFAVADPGVVDLDVALRSSHGVAVAGDHTDKPWAVLQADRPLCALGDDTWTVEVGAKRGRGRFALEVWMAPATQLLPRAAGDAGTN